MQNTNFLKNGQATRKYFLDHFIWIDSYARRILQRFGFDECKPVATLMLKDSGLQESNIKITNFPHRQAVSALMYLMVGTRPDLAYSGSFISRSLENPSAEDSASEKSVPLYSWYNYIWNHIPSNR